MVQYSCITCTIRFSLIRECAQLRTRDVIFVPLRHVSGSIMTKQRAGAMTLEDVRTKTGRIREYPAIPFLLVAAVSVVGALFRVAPQAVSGGPISAGDTAWMLTATGLVL